MRKLALSVLAAVLISLPIMGTGCQKLQARDHLNKGVTAFKNAQYPEAVEHFKQAVELDPNFPTARLYLATAYMQQYIPGAESDDNKKMADAAESTFKDVLKDNPKDPTAIAYLASLYLNEKRWDESKAWYDKLTSVDPKSAVGYYSKGFIAWSQWYPADGTARAELGMKLEDPGPIKDKKVREELKAKYFLSVSAPIWPTTKKSTSSRSRSPTIGSTRPWRSRRKRPKRSKRPVAVSSRIPGSSFSPS